MDGHCQGVEKVEDATQKGFEKIQGQVSREVWQGLEDSEENELGGWREGSRFVNTTVNVENRKGT